MYQYIARIDVSKKSISALSDELKSSGIVVEKYFKSIDIVVLKSTHLIEEHKHQCLSNLELLGERKFKINEEE
jgi:hypothetical protein